MRRGVFLVALFSLVMAAMTAVENLDTLLCRLPWVEKRLLEMDLGKDYARRVYLDPFVPVWGAALWIESEENKRQLFAQPIEEKRYESY